MVVAFASFAAKKCTAMQLNFKEIASVSIILFSVIDMMGNVPVIVDLRKKAGRIQSGKATIVAGMLMIAIFSSDR